MASQIIYEILTSFLGILSLVSRSPSDQRNDLKDLCAKGEEPR